MIQEGRDKIVVFDLNIFFLAVRKSKFGNARELSVDLLLQFLLAALPRHGDSPASSRELLRNVS